MSGFSEEDPLYVDTLVLPNTIESWTDGAEILITSHTEEWYDQQTRRIQSVGIAKRGFVAVKLDKPIERPLTEQDDPELAVEVALLSRNIVFEGGYDSNYLHGGQFVVFHTPQIEQVLEGVEIKNFGQQGYLGRYPIHFHFCDHVDGSLVAKNTIRQSNQRCVVVHGTHNLVIQENVAFDTKGHCFIVEDGYETGNKFLYNLGALTDAPEVAIPNMGTNGEETDQKMPSTFWITNPTNIYVGNVAAGSSDSGFWFELQLRGDRANMFPNLDPKRASLALFKENVAHSNGKVGFRAYPSGYRPYEEAVFDNLKSFRNQKGVFLHLSKNIKIEGGLFADNRQGVEIDRADDIVMENSVIVGVSPAFREQLASKGITKTCRQLMLIGLEHHTWKMDYQNGGSYINNITFTGFADSGCPEAKPIYVDYRVSLTEIEN